MQTLQPLLKSGYVAAGEELTVVMSPNEDLTRLTFNIRAGDNGCAACWPSVKISVDGQWAAAWAKISHQSQVKFVPGSLHKTALELADINNRMRKQIEEASSKDPVLKKKILEVAEAIATDPGMIANKNMKGVFISPADANFMAASYRARS